MIIIGASGHGKVVADIAELNGYDDIVFLDADPTKKECGGHPIVGTDNDCSDLKGDVFVAIGNAEARKRIMERESTRNFPVLIHPSAVVAKSAKIGKGSVIMAGAVINPGTVIGKGCIVNTCSSVDHDCVLGDFVHVSVGAHLSGTIKVGEETWIGAGVTVNNNVDICGGCMIGAGAVVVNSIDEAGTYIGIPAALKK